MRPRLVLFVLILAAAALATYTIVRAATLSITYDEGWTLTGVGQSVADILTFRRNDINTHPLNSILIKVARRVLGQHTFVYRLPNVAAHLLYLGASILMARRARSLPAVLAGFALLNLNPFLLDFFSLARGYGLALAFTLCGLVCLARALDRPGGRDEAAACACLALATLSNLAFLHGLVALLGVILLLAAERARHGPRRLRAFASASWGPALVTFATLAVLFPPMRRLQAAGQFYFGGFHSFWGDTVGSLTHTLLYQDAASPLSASLALLAGVLVAVCGLTALEDWRDHAFRLARTPSLAFFLLLCLPGLSTTAFHYVLGSRFLLERTALLFVPLFAVAVLTASARWHGRLARAGLLALVLLLAANTGLAANLRWTLSWRYDADVRDVVRLLQEEHRRTGRPIHLVLSWPFKMPIWYYAKQWDLPWLQQDVFEYGEKKVHFDYCYLLGGDYDFGYRMDRRFLDAHRDRIVRTFPLSGSYLIEGDHR